MHANTIGGLRTSGRIRLALGFTTAMAAVLLSGCATNTAPRAEVSAEAAQRDMARGRPDRAIAHAEAAALAQPHNPAYRLVLGNAYLDAGRFGSAETAFSDAMTLGDTTPRAALALALAQIAQAKYAPAVALLGEYDGQIAAADLGLALALAGQPERGIHIMSNAIRGGENTIKMRQNLAYAYAMAGRWREARLMAQQDVPAGEVGHRMEQWAQMVPAEAYQHRVAGLLGVPVGASDMGQPMHLALGNNPSVEQLLAEAAGPAPGEPAAAMVFADSNIAQANGTQSYVAPFARELPATAAPNAHAPVVAAAAGDFSTAFAPVPAPARAPAPTTLAAQDAGGIISRPVVQALPALYAAAPATRTPRAAPAVAAVSPVLGSSGDGDGTHLVQLGSFLSQQGARRAWDIYLGRYPELADREMVISEAVVRGRHYWRVSAGGYSQNASRNLCNRVRGAGEGCMTWAANRPLPGAVDSGVRLARR